MPILTTGNTFVDGNQVTALKLNDAVNLAAFTSGAVDAVTTVLSSGAVSVKDGGITAAKLATGVNGALFIGNGTGFTNTTLTASTSIAVTNASGAITLSVADSGITAAKLATGVNGALFIGNGTGFTNTTLTAGAGITVTNASGAITLSVADGGITAAKIASGAVTAAKLESGVNGALFIGNGTGFTNAILTADAGFSITNGSGSIALGVSTSGITTAKLADAGVTTIKLADANVTTAKLANLNVTAAKLESGTDGQLFIGNGSGFTKATLTAGSDITITNASAGITIAATAPSTLSSISAANTYAGTLNNDLVLGTGNGFAGVTLTVGKWLVTGNVTVRSSTGTTIRLVPVFWDGTTEYSCSTGVETSDLSIRFSVPASAIMTVASGTRAIVYKIKTGGGGETIDAGTTFGSSSVITAVRLTETP